MATVRVKRRSKERPLAVTILLTTLGYGLVIGTFADVVPLYPDIGEVTVDLLSHLIAVVNAGATICLVFGWYWIRKRAIARHRIAMLSAFVLIVLFLLLYLPKVGGGGEKYFVFEPAYAWVPVWWWIEPAYLLMLAIHILLSVVAVPLVIYAVVLGLTHTPAELADTAHARIGRLAAAAWILSLVLGIVTYVMLNHLYSSTFVPLLVG